MKTEPFFCNICKNKVKLVVSNCQGYQEPHRFSIYLCEKCDTSFSSPDSGSDSIYEIIYNNAEKISGYSRYVDFAAEVKKTENALEYLKNTEETYFASINVLQKLGKRDPHIKILEIGCGLGYFTYSVHKAGFNIVGLDISQKAVDNARSIFGDLYICEDVFKYSQHKPETYDLIIANQLIEHVATPLAFTRALKLLLKPRGVIVYTTPNKSVYPTDAVWKTPDLPPVHCFWFSEDSFKMMASFLQMDISFFDFSGWYSVHPKFLGYVYKNTILKCSPTIGRDGELIKGAGANKGHGKTWIDAAKMQIVKIRKSRLFLKWKYRLLGYYYECGKNGDVLCGIFENK